MPNIHTKHHVPASLRKLLFPRPASDQRVPGGGPPRRGGKEGGGKGPIGRSPMSTLAQQRRPANLPVHYPFTTQWSLDESTAPGKASNVPPESRRILSATRLRGMYPPNDKGIRYDIGTIRRVMRPTRYAESLVMEAEAARRIRRVASTAHTVPGHPGTPGRPRCGTTQAGSSPIESGTPMRVSRATVTKPRGSSQLDLSLRVPTGKGTGQAAGRLMASTATRRSPMATTAAVQLGLLPRQPDPGQPDPRVALRAAVGDTWQEVVHRVFTGTGACGNASPMLEREGPIGDTDDR